MAFNQHKYINNWAKAHMGVVKGSYKSEFVGEYRNALRVLGKGMSQSIREKMVADIAEANKKVEGLKTIYRVDNGISCYLIDEKRAIKYYDSIRAEVNKEGGYVRLFKCIKDSAIPITDVFYIDDRGRIDTDMELSSLFTDETKLREFINM